MNVLLGGTLYQDIRNHRGGVTHEVAISGGLMASAFNSETVTVNSYHHECVKDLGQGLTITATHSDGTVEAYEDASRNIYGVQWHPEYSSNGSATGSKFITAFMDVVYRAMNQN